MQASAQSNTAEITFSQLALERSSRKRIQDYAQDIISDHTTAGVQLQQLAQQKGVALETSLDANSAALAAILSGLTGRAFDRTYLETLIIDHVESLRLALLTSRYATDADVRAFASAQVPILRSHLRAAQRLALGRLGRGTGIDHILGASRATVTVP